MIWEALIGGAVGGLLAGPWGMVTGAALGAGLDVLRGKEVPPLAATLVARPGADGLLLEATLAEPLGGGLAVITAHSLEDTPLRATVGRFADAEGLFHLSVEVADSQIRAFVPYGVLEAGERSPVVFVLRVVQTPEENELDLLGEERLEAAWPRTPYSAARFWRPMLGLSMAVARADGRVEQVEVRAVRERASAGLRIPAAEAEQVTAILKSEPAAPLPDLLAELHLRAPRSRPRVVLSALVDVARADGAVHAAEAAVITEVARLLGVTGPAWVDLAAELGLTDLDPLQHYREVLGVPPGASAEDIEQAYTRQAARYSPDRVEGLPEDFRALAWRHTETIQNARAALLRALPAPRTP